METGGPPNADRADHDSVIGMLPTPISVNAPASPPTNTHPWRCATQGDAIPAFITLNVLRRSPMRKLMSVSIAVMFALFAVGTWAAATTGSHEEVGLSGYRINVSELMSNANHLPVQQYDSY
jgi:hypothetical protein